MKPLRLIIVEDSEDDALLILRELEKGGYSPGYVRVETAAGLQEALDRGPWDLVISDHALPLFSAPEALREINRRNTEIPFIIVSSVIGEEVAVASMKAGAQDYIMKSNLTRLVPVIERALYEAGVRAEREKTREALRESEERFRRLAENAPDLIYRLRLLPGFAFDYLSPAVKTLTGYSPEELQGNPRLGMKLIYPDDRPVFKAYFEKAVNIGQPLVLRWLHREGRLLWVEQRNAPLYDENGILVAVEGIARDITGRIRRERQLENSHAQIEALSNRILGAMEEERARLARELHDELGQALTAIKLDLQMLGEQITGTGQGREHLKQSIALVDHTISLVRRQSVSLRPPALDDMGLLPAIKEMAGGFSKRTGIEVVISAAAFRGRLPGPVETALYRCVQESLTNVARHAAASRVEISLQNNNGHARISVSDNGSGFDPQKIKISVEHIGLTGMQERVKLLAGELIIDTAPGRGTKILIEVPCGLLSSGAAL